jgi:hypothetical protein
MTDEVTPGQLARTVLGTAADDLAARLALWCSDDLEQARRVADALDTLARRLDDLIDAATP